MAYSCHSLPLLFCKGFLALLYLLPLLFVLLWHLCVLSLICAYNLFLLPSEFLCIPFDVSLSFTDLASFTSFLASLLEPIISHVLGVIQSYSVVFAYIQYIFNSFYVDVADPPPTHFLSIDVTCMLFSSSKFLSMLNLFLSMMLKSFRVLVSLSLSKSNFFLAMFFPFCYVVLV